jgi:hypothetical protein
VPISQTSSSSHRRRPLPTGSLAGSIHWSEEMAKGLYTPFVFFNNISFYLLPLPEGGYIYLFFLFFLPFYSLYPFLTCSIYLFLCFYLPPFVCM